jgi:FKBP-type peptidyl-prolyl cis-trans isomerase FkpA
MNRAALVILFLATLLAACGKSTDSGIVAYNAQKVIDDKIIADYLAANPGLGAKKVDTSGVYYIVTDPGSGNAVFTNSTSVTVGYVGRLLYDGKAYTGREFTKTNDFHPSFSLQQVILGWKLGIPKIKKDGTVRLLIPSRYAYGPNEQPLLGLPAHAVLDFDITLYDIIN